jgi:hypothetical protein
MSHGWHFPLIATIAAATVIETRGGGGDPTGTTVASQNSIPGFVAVAAARGATVAQEEVERFADAYQAICGDGGHRRSYAAPNALLVEFTNENGSVSAGSPGSWVVVAGSTHGGRDGGAVEAPLPDGQFALAAYDEPSETLSVASDPFGMFPLFRASTRGSHYFSTSALALAKHLSAQPDVLGLFIFLRTGYHFGRRTNWAGVERFDPAERLVLAPTGVRIERYWRPEPDESICALDLAGAARHCIETCLETYRASYVDERDAWADLTGGYDSRLLTLALTRAGVDVHTNTVGADWTEDVRIAREVAAAAGLPWRMIPALTEAGDDSTRLIRLALAAGHGHLDVLELARVLAVHEAQTASSWTLLTGGGGEHFNHYPWQTEFVQAGRSNRFSVDRFLRMRMLGSVDTSIFADYPEREVEGDIADRCVAWIAPYRSELNTRQLDLLYAYKMTGHFGAFTGAASSVLRTELPYYLRAVFLSAFSTHHRHRNAHRLMRRMLQLLHPRVAALRTTHGGPAEPTRLGNLHRFLPYYGLLTAKAIQKLTGVRVHRPRAERRVATSSGLRAAALDAVREGDGRWRSRALFKPAELELLLDQAAHPDMAREQLFGRILTVEAALRAVDAEVDRNGAL